MKKFILIKVIRHTETAEVVAKSWDDAKAMLSDDTEFVSNHDDVIIDERMEYIGETS